MAILTRETLHEARFPVLLRSSARGTAACACRCWTPYATSRASTYRSSSRWWTCSWKAAARTSLFLRRRFSPRHEGASEKRARPGALPVARHPRESFTIATKCLAGPHRQRRGGEVQPWARRLSAWAPTTRRLLPRWHPVTGGARTGLLDERGFPMGFRTVEQKAAGRIRKAGMFHHPFIDSPEALDAPLEAHPIDAIIETVQLQVNYLDWENPLTSGRACMEVAAIEATACPCSSHGAWARGGLKGAGGATRAGGHGGCGVRTGLSMAQHGRTASLQAARVLTVDFAAHVHDRPNAPERGRLRADAPSAASSGTSARARQAFDARGASRCFVQLAVNYLLGRPCGGTAAAWRWPREGRARGRGHPTRS